MHQPIRSFLILAWLAFLAGCASPVTYVRPREWSSHAAVDSIVASYRPFLQGRRIFLDPGHGGEDRVNRGPREEAIEADVNLRVGLALRGYLSSAGATVLMSRDHDTTVQLRDRMLIALRDSAEIFISLHHNATASTDQATNYAAVYYHGREGSPEYHPANHDIARYIERDMSYAMRNAGAPFSPTFDGTLSDFDIYPNSGFAVLRQNAIPAVLIEASFFTHPPEEQRLAVQEFNQIEAWGIFLGLGRYFRAGVPALSLLSDTLVPDARPTLRVAAAPPGNIDRTSLHLFIDGREIPAQEADTPGVVTVMPNRNLGSGRHMIAGWVRNRQGNSSWPFRKSFTVMLPAESITMMWHPAALPASNNAWARVITKARDQSGLPVADGSLVHLTLESAGIDTALTTTGGVAVAYIPSRNQPGRIEPVASSGRAMVRGDIPVVQSAERYIGGTVRTTAGVSVEGAAVTIQGDTMRARPDTLDVTPPDGRYIAFGPLPAFSALTVLRPGYFVKREVIQPVSQVTLHDISLTPVANGILFGKTYVLDARYGGPETGDVAGTERSSDVNLAVVRRLHSLLTAAGANVILMRTGDDAIPESERSHRTIGLPRGKYVRIDASSAAMKVSCEVYPNPANKILGSIFLLSLGASTGLDTAGVFGSADPFYREVTMATISVKIPSVKTGYYTGRLEERVDAVAWGVLDALLRTEGFVRPTRMQFLVRDAAGTPLPGVRADLDGTFTRFTDSSGVADFAGLDIPGSSVTIPGNPGAAVSGK